MTRPVSRLPRFVFAAFLLAGGVAFADELPLPLEAADPDKPLEVLWDHTYSEAELLSKTAAFDPAGTSPEIPYDEGKGPLFLVVDLAATRTGDAKGHARLGISVECPGTPCGIPIDRAVMGMDTQFMGESVAIIGGQPAPVWVQRRTYAYTFKPGQTATFGVRLEESENLQPRVVRARLIHGIADDDALPGQTTRKGLLMKVVGTVLGLFVLLVWWMRRA